MFTTRIENRQGRGMYVHVFDEHAGKHAPTVILQHGRSSRYDSPHNMAITTAFTRSGHRVISLDATNSSNNLSAGDSEDFTISNHVNDMADTIEWARRNNHIREEKFALAGHCMGGFSALFLAATIYHDQVSHVLACSPFIDGHKQMEALLENQPGVARKWEREGAIDEPNESWSHMSHITWGSFVAMQDYSLYPLKDALTMPVYVTVGTGDKITPAKDILSFALSVPGNVGISVVPNANHNYSNALPQLEEKARVGAKHLKSHAYMLAHPQHS